MQNYMIIHLTQLFCGWIYSSVLIFVGQQFRLFSDMKFLSLWALKIIPNDQVLQNYYNTCKSINWSKYSFNLNFTNLTD